MTAWAIALIAASLIGAGWAVVAIRLYGTRKSRHARHRKDRHG